MAFFIGLELVVALLLVQKRNKYILKKIALIINKFIRVNLLLKNKLF